MDVSVILPVVNETFSLRKTIEIINNTSSSFVKEYIIVICKFTTKDSIAEINDLKKDFPGLIKVHNQIKPYLGGALQEAFQIAVASHIILMASDLETDPWLVEKLIQEELNFEYGIVTASRWIRGGSFKGYSKMKLILNWIFQKMISLLYLSKLTDMTYAFRIMPTKVMQSICWEELRHPFLLETLIKPIRLKIPVKEIPAIWEARIEGDSQNTFLRTFSYLKIAVKARFQSIQSITKD